MTGARAELSGVVSSKAFIRRSGWYLLQLRDETPGIYYPGHWGLFGGQIEPGETPAQGLVRELGEELNWVPRDFCYLYPWQPKDGSVVHIFLAVMDVAIDRLDLAEGAGMALVDFGEMLSLQLAPEVSENMDEVARRVAAEENTSVDPQQGDE